MNSLKDGILIILISLLSNAFVQRVITIIFDVGDDNTDLLYLLILAGAFGLILADMIKEHNDVISKGFQFGSYILLIDVIMSNWEIMDDKLKLFVTGMFLLKFFKYAKNKN